MQDNFSLDHLTDNELIEATHRANNNSQRATALLLAHLAEIDRRKLYLATAKPSMFQYAVDTLGLSEAAAYVRITAARAARAYPMILDLVAEGALHLTAIKLVSPHLSPQNHRALLEAVRNKSARAVELELAGRFPKPDVPQVLRKLPAPRAAKTEDGFVGTLTAPPAGRQESQHDSSLDSSRNELAAKKAPPRPTVAAQPLSPQRYKLQVTLSKETHDKLQKAQKLLRHQVSNGDLAEVIDRALDALVDEQMKRQFGATDRPRNKQTQQAKTDGGGGKTGAPSRHIPHAVRRQVLERDGLRCSYHDDDGNRCEQTAFLQLHHLEPFGKGGGHSAENVRIFCQAHNRHAAEQDYGVECMKNYSQGKKGPSEVREPSGPYQLSPPGTEPPSGSTCRPSVRICALAKNTRQRAEELSKPGPT